MLLIYIPTKGRSTRQTTLSALPTALLERTWLVSPESEVEELQRLHPKVLTQPAQITSIAQKRAWIVEQCPSKKLIMLDDDLSFYARGHDDGRLLKEYATTSKILGLFSWIERSLDELAHVGISSRLGNNYVEETEKRTTRMMHAIAYHVPVMRRVVKFNRVAFREDFDYTLQLLRKGYDNCVRYDVCVAPGSYGASGGCSDERTVEKSDLEALKLARLHPGLVQVVQRDYKGVPRKEVIVRWRKALGADL